MGVIYGVVDVLDRTSVPTHLETLERLDVLHSVLTMDSRGYTPSSVVHEMPAKLGSGRFLSPTAFNNLCDLYLRRHVEEAEALIGWSGMSSFTIERANDLGLTTFVYRASPHLLEMQSMHDAEYERFGKRSKTGALNAWKECYEYQAADWIVTVSEYAAESFERYGVSRDKVLVVPYDCNVDQYLTTPDESDPETFTVCTATTVDLLRGVPYLLEAWAVFAKSKDDVELRIAGTRDDSFPDHLYEEFAQRADVTFHGYVDDVQTLYAESDVFVLPSLADGGPCGPMEAMAAGLPVIVSDHMGAQGEVTDGENGFVVPAAASEPIAARLEELYASAERRAEMGKNARKAVRGCGGRQAAAVEQLYQNHIKS